MNKESSEKQINIDQATPRDIWCLASANLLATWRDIASSVPGLPMTPEENWIDAILLDAVDRLITGDRAPDTVQLMREACEIKHWLVRWNAYGCPVYAPTHGLASALILTDCSEVRGRDLQWPYPSVLVELPWPQGPISFYDCANTKVLEGRFLIVHRILFPHLDDGFNRAVEMLNSALQSPTPKFIPGLPDLRRRMLEAVTMRAT